MAFTKALTLGMSAALDIYSRQRKSDPFYSSTGAGGVEHFSSRASLTSTFGPRTRMCFLPALIRLVNMWVRSHEQVLLALESGFLASHVGKVSVKLSSL